MTGPPHRREAPALPEPPDSRSEPGLAETMALLVTPGSRVACVGTGLEPVVEALGRRHCRVSVVELDEAAAGTLTVPKDRVRVAAPDQVSLEKAFPDAAFDAALLLELLGRVEDPAKTLRAVADALAPGGRVIVATANPFHGAARLKVLRGEAVQAAGVGAVVPGRVDLDPQAVLRGFADAGLSVLERLPVRRPVWGPATGLDRTSFPAEVVRMVEEDPEAETAVVVLVGSLLADAPTEAAGLATRLHDELVRATLAERDGIRRLALLEADRARLGDRLERLSLDVAAWTEVAEVSLDRLSVVGAATAELNRVEAARNQLGEELARLRDEHRLLGEDLALKDDFVLEVRAQAAAEAADLQRQLAEARDQVATLGRLLRAQAGELELHERALASLRAGQWPEPPAPPPPSEPAAPASRLRRTAALARRTVRALRAELRGR